MCCCREESRVAPRTRTRTLGRRIMAMFNCPKCFKTIAELPAKGSVIAMCSDCRFKYEVVRGKLLDRTTSLASGQRDNPTRRYQLKLEVRTGRAELAEIDYRSEEHTSELQSLRHIVCRLL